MNIIEKGVMNAVQRAGAEATVDGSVFCIRIINRNTREFEFLPLEQVLLGKTTTLKQKIEEMELENKNLKDEISLLNQKIEKISKELSETIINLASYVDAQRFL